MDPATEIASDFTVEQYHAMRSSIEADHSNTEGWQTLLAAFRRRLEERFLRPIADLERSDENGTSQIRPGFAILALDCLLIDTLQSFREGRIATGEISPSASFISFLRSAPSFKSFSSRDRSRFVHYVRNGLLHNGETRGDWKVRRIGGAILNKEGAIRIINRRRFHGGVVEEYEAYCNTLLTADSDVRVRFLRRMDSICGWPTDPLTHFYFAYGSNLSRQEILTVAPEAEGFSQAYLPLHRLVFDKHSVSRHGDAANILEDPTSVVWGYTYRLSDVGRAGLLTKEKGYNELEVQVVLPGENDPSFQSAFTFIARDRCADACGPTPTYSDAVLSGAKERDLPKAYLDLLSSSVRVDDLAKTLAGESQ